MEQCSGFIKKYFDADPFDPLKTISPKVKPASHFVAVVKLSSFWALFISRISCLFSLSNASSACFLSFSSAPSGGRTFTKNGDFSVPTF